MRSHRFAPSVAVAVLAAAISTAAPVAAQRVDSAFKGSVLGQIAARGDTAFHYAAYIPERYSPDRPAPLLLVLDPRGRAELAIEKVVSTAERLGWIVLSSYDTRSDDPKAPNEKAVNLMVDDAIRTFAIDTARLYLAGFSGTARDSWAMAYGAGGHVAGIVSADASMPGDSAWRSAHTRPPPFDVAMSAATRGFNYDEVFLTTDTLRALGAPVRTDEFVGGHQWSPQPVLAQSLGWLEARAMARGLRPVDRVFVDSVFAIDSARAAALEAGGHVGEAVLAWRNVMASWRGLHDLTPVANRLAALTAQPAVARWVDERDSLLRLSPTAQNLLSAPLRALRKQPGVPDIRRLTEQMQVVKLRQWADDTVDTVRAAWAVRMLAGMSVDVSFYEPEAYLSVGDASRALAVLVIAEEIQPGAPGICRERARAYALRRDADRTLTELRCALAGSAITLAEIRADGRYQFMRAVDAFVDLVGEPGR